MSEQHTAGPWQVGPLANREDGNGNDERVIELYDGGPCIATAWPMGEDCDREDAPAREANARLIAAAPDLLAALRDLVESLQYEELRDGTYPDLSEARALLARIAGDHAEASGPAGTVPVPGTVQGTVQDVQYDPCPECGAAWYHTAICSQGRD
jgi:hypothetical protein